MRENPIGIFDSGVGGLTVWKEVHSLLPLESCIYLADSKNAPYGQRTKEEIISLCVKNTEFLLSKGCKLIVIACNTATTNAITTLRQNYKIPFIGIEPAIKPAALQTITGNVGVLATQGTLSSTLFKKTSNDYGREIRIIEREGKGLVPLIEAGKIDSEEIKKLLTTYMQPMIEADVDNLVLGCTHYPHLIPVLKSILPQNVAIIDCGIPVAKQTLAVLKETGLRNFGEKKNYQEFYTNGNKESIDFFLKEYGLQQRSIPLNL